MGGGSTEGGGSATFNPAAPDNHYILNLGIPTERAVALQLCQLDIQSEVNLLKNIKVDGSSVHSCKAAGWPER